MLPSLNKVLLFLLLLKSTERNKHLNFCKQTKQKDENNNKPISARKGKSNNRENVTLGSYRVYSKFQSSRLKTRQGSAVP